jgi:heat shock protein HtpX
MEILIMRILLFLGTNIAFMALVGLTFSLFGIQGLLATVIVMWFSRYRKFKADASGAKLAGNNNMIAALKRLQSFKGAPELPDEMAALAINAGKVQAIFSSHPPSEQRIKALQNLRL